MLDMQLEELPAEKYSFQLVCWAYKPAGKCHYNI